MLAEIKTHLRFDLRPVHSLQPAFSDWYGASQWGILAWHRDAVVWIQRIQKVMTITLRPMEQRVLIILN